MAKCPQKMLHFFTNLLFLFIFFSALFFGSVEPNGRVAFVRGYRRETATTRALNAKIAEGYEIVSSANAGDNDYFLWTLVKNDDKQNQIDALGHKIDTLIQKIDHDGKEQQKSVDTLVKAISSLVEQLDKKSVKLTLW